MIQAKHMISFIRHLILAALLGGTAFAQKEAKERTCRILFLEGPDSAPNTLHLFDGTRAREVELPRLNLSKIYEIPAGNLTLTLLPAPPADPEKLPAGAPNAKLPETVTDFFLLLTSDPANTVAPVRMQIIPAGADRLRAGQMLWFNLTAHQIGGVVGSEKLIMRPQSTVTLKAPASSAGDYHVELAYRIEGKETVYPICETQWRHDPRSRSLAFVFAKPGTRTPRVQVFPDFRMDTSQPKNP
jgi:hypothetical protein